MEDSIARGAKEEGGRVDRLLNYWLKGALLTEMATPVLALEPFATVTCEAVRAVVLVTVVGVRVAEGCGRYRTSCSNCGTGYISGGGNRPTIAISVVALSLFRHRRGGHHSGKHGSRGKQFELCHRFPPLW
jgi:hypothetical protein